MLSFRLSDHKQFTSKSTSSKCKRSFSEQTISFRMCIWLHHMRNGCRSTSSILERCQSRNWVITSMGLRWSVWKGLTWWKTGNNKEWRNWISKTKINVQSWERKWKNFSKEKMSWLRSIRTWSWTDKFPSWKSMSFKEQRLSSWI